VKYSEAIRIGATKRSQCTGVLFLVEGGQALKSCANGAAFEAVMGLPRCSTTSFRFLVNGKPFYGSYATLLEQHLDVSLHKEVVNPAAPQEDPNYVYAVVMALNDRFGWSREAIADWLESIGY
jgi:hypothetical protein